MTSRMMVKRDPEADSIALRNYFADGLRCRIPLRIIPRQLIAFGTSPRSRISVGRDLIGEDQKASASIADQLRRTSDKCQAVRVCCGIAQLDIDEG